MTWFGSLNKQIPPTHLSLSLSLSLSNKLWIFPVSYEEKDLTYQWRSELESDIYIYDKEMAQFDIVSAKRYPKHEIYHSRKLYAASYSTRNHAELESQCDWQCVAWPGS